MPRKAYPLMTGMPRASSSIARLKRRHQLFRPVDHRRVCEDAEA